MRLAGNMISKLASRVNPGILRLKGSGDATMATAALSGDHILLENITWGTYERLLREAGERHIRMTYDNGDLEIMTLSFGHENAGEVLGRLIDTLTLELNIPLRSGGSTTLKKKLKRKGLEPDKCFWIKNEK